MGNIFAGSEIVEIGIEIEKNGNAFYNTLAGKTKDKAVKQVFIFLAQEEEKHINIFKSILEKTDKYDPPEVYADEYFAYMRTLAANYVFTKKNKGEEIASLIKSDIEAVDKGIGFEKDSIIFYEGMKKAVPDFDHSILDELIRQEQIHFKQLSDLKAKL